MKISNVRIQIISFYTIANNKLNFVKCIIANVLFKNTYNSNTVKLKIMFILISQKQIHMYIYLFEAHDYDSFYVYYIIRHFVSEFIYSVTLRYIF